MKLSDYQELQKEVERERQLALLKQQMASPYYLSQQQRGVQFAQTKIESIERTNDNTYVNVVLDHPEATFAPGRGGVLGPQFFITNPDPVVAEYEVTKTETILSNCSEYYCAVIRFTIPLDEVPLLICPIVPNQPNPVLTTFIIGIQYGDPTLPGSFFSQQVTYNPQNNFPAPIQNQPTQVITPFYFIYSYQNILEMFNVALSLAYIASGLSVLFPGYLAPYFQFNTGTGLFSLTVPSFFTTLTAPALFIPRIYANIASTTFFFSFDLFSNVSNISSNINPLGNDFYFITNPNENNKAYINGVTIPPTTIPPALPAQSFYYEYTQEYSVIEYWTSLRKIIILSNSIPGKNEYVPATNNVNNFGISDNSGVNVSYPILTDFVPNISPTAGDSRSIAYYVPQSQYRLVDLISTNPLQKIDIRIFWQDRDGNLYPLLLSLYQQASIKLGFFRKSLYNATTLTKV